MKRENGETEIGSYKDCHKEYLNYTIEKVYNIQGTYDLVLINYQDKLNNTEKYMTIDYAEIYKIDTYTGFEQKMNSGLSLDLSGAPYRIRIHLTGQDMNNRFKIKFFSSKCKYNQEHYLYTTYYFDGFGAQLSTSLSLTKHY